MVVYLNKQSGKAYTKTARNNYVFAQADIEGAFENWLDDNFLASEVLGANYADLHREYVEELMQEFEEEYTPIELELV